jgi:hypothetical protein
MGKEIELRDLAMNAEVKFGGMVWIVKKKDDSNNTVTLALKESIQNMEFDAAELGNTDEWVRDYGNNIYEFSNIRQWLNSSGGDWFRKQHDHDAAPSYVGKKGFRSQFSKKEIKQIMPREIVAGHFPDFFYLPAAEEKDLVTGEEFDQDWVWTRTPNSTNSYHVRIVNSSGALYSTIAYSGNYGVRPLCDLKSETKVKRANGAWEVGKRKKKKKTTGAPIFKWTDVQITFRRNTDCPLIEVENTEDDKKLKYERLREEMAEWPDWKKRAYNEMFATSTHSEKLEVDE